MEWMGLNELREQYLAFFESKGHLRLPSFSLVPQEDKSLLLINSGMAPLKKYFVGEQTPPRLRVATCQKCIRTPDIERVGKTARHGTYFEMLGNFSFGEYFKHEATRWAWEFCTETLRMDPARIYISIFLEDDEAFRIWTKEVGVPEDHMVRLGREDNFWEHGAGPCGPCSELYYDRGEAYGCGSPDCGAGCDCDRFMEFWNLVFTQLDSDGKGGYTPLAKKNIDTGMGLERLACLLQGVDNLFEVDTVQRILQHVTRVANIAYRADEKSDVSLRVITDHIRSTTMLIGDGVLPSNEGRGYVLRRLLRRAARHGRLLGIERPFLQELAQTVIAENASAYPLLEEKRDYILRVIANEEESFSRTIDAGLQLLESMIEALEGTVLGGAEAFLLSDTFGFPVDLTEEILTEKGLTLDRAGFDALVTGQRERSRAARRDAGAEAWKSKGDAVQGLPATIFLGYTQETAQAKVLCILAQGERADYAAPGIACSIVLDQTPFYPEGGGQAGDTGVLRGKGFVFAVEGTGKMGEGVILHHGTLVSGDALTVGDTVEAEINRAARMAIRRNHTAAHLLHAALRKVLGSHVEQAGQSVTAKSLRFDFTHFSALTQEELSDVERLVNEAVWAAVPVETKECDLEEAKAAGAMALFGEKYGARVRVVRVGEYSAELCGGTHAENSGNLGLFHVLYENSVASGIRRIEGLTAALAMDFFARQQASLQRSAALLKANNANELEARAAAVMAQLKEKEREATALAAQLSGFRVQELLQGAQTIGTLRFVCGLLDSADAEDLRQACDSVKESGERTAALFARRTEKGTLQFAAACTAAAVASGAHAGNLVRAAAQAAGGSGGGKAESAMAGGKDPAKLEDAFGAARALLASIGTEGFQ